ncbi:hypothetical protein LJR267_009694 [Paraburkholderia hospita]|uniref:hypothetical protein n=1 Tax=Paraburkholderia hospita TaxID=169430 RepID=UPI003ECD7027
MDEIDTRLKIPRVLVVSPDLEVAASLKDFLEREALTVDCLDAVSDVLSRLSDIAYDLLLVDAAPAAH